MADWIGRLIEDAGLVGVALLMLLETVFPPIPSEVIMPLAGLAAARGEAGLAGVVVAGAAGAMVGNLLWFLVARGMGLERVQRLVRRHGRWLAVKPAELDRADRLFDRWGGPFVMVGRVVPTIRSLVSVPAGLFGMRLVPFLLWSTAGTLAWTGALAGAGYLLGERYGAVGRWLEPISTTVILLLAAAYLWRILRSRS